MTTENGIRLLLSADKSGQTMSGELVLQVYEIYRYAVDEEYRHSMRAMGQEVQARQLSAYDVVLGDRRFKIKCALSPRHNDDVQKCRIKVGAWIRVSRWRLWREEVDLSARGFARPATTKQRQQREKEQDGEKNSNVSACVVVLECRRVRVSRVVDALAYNGDGEWSDGARDYERVVDGVSFQREALFRDDVVARRSEVKVGNARFGCRLRGKSWSLRPLLGARQHYMHALNDDCVLANGWARRDIDIALDADVAADVVDGSGVPTIREVCKSRGRKRSRNSKHRMMAGRVTWIGRVRHFAKPSDVRKPWPIHYQFGLTDATEHIVVVVWGASCCLYFESIDVGDLVVLRNFRLRPAYPDGVGGLEASINPPDACIRVVRDERRFRLPPAPRHAWTIAASLDHLTALSNPEATFDVFGIVVSVGRFERHRYGGASGSTATTASSSSASPLSGAFGLYRWARVALLGDMRQVLPLQLYTNSQLDVVASLRCGDAMLVSNAKLLHLKSEHFDVYASSSLRSRTYRHPALPPFVPSAGRVITAHNFYEPPSPKPLPSFHTVFLASSSLPFYRATFPSVEFAPLRTVLKLANELHAFERRTVLARGYLSSVQRITRLASNATSAFDRPHLAQSKRYVDLLAATGIGGGGGGDQQQPAHQVLGNPDDDINPLTDELMFLLVLRDFNDTKRYRFRSLASASALASSADDGDEQRRGERERDGRRCLKMSRWLATVKRFLDLDWNTAQLVEDDAVDANLDLAFDENYPTVTLLLEMYRTSAASTQVVATTCFGVQWSPLAPQDGTNNDSDEATEDDDSKS
jgi:hypothetical protein